jgi:hypothetical protein
MTEICSVGKTSSGINEIEQAWAGAENNRTTYNSENKQNRDIASVKEHTTFAGGASTWADGRAAWRGRHCGEKRKRKEGKKRKKEEEAACTHFGVTK